MNAKNDSIALEEIRILFIDDEEGNLELHKRELIKYGYKNFETAKSAKEALEMFGAKKHFDVIVADMRMEENGSGFDIIKEGEERLASTMIILTANDNVLDCRKSFKMGAWDYIPKTTGNFNVFEELHKSITAAINYNREWGNSSDESWISEHIDELTDKFPDKYVAIMDKEAIANANTEDELIKKMKDDGLPTFMPVIVKVPGGDMI